MKKEEKTNTWLIIILTLIVGMCVGIGGYYLYTLVSKSNTKKENATIKELTDTKLINKLHDVVTSKDKSYGLYSDKKLTLDNIDDEVIILYALSNFNFDYPINQQNNIFNDNYKPWTEEEINLDSFYTTNKDLNNYINKLFNINKTYALDSEDILWGSFSICLYSNKTDSYYCGSYPSSTPNITIYNDVVKAEITSDSKYIYIYDKPIELYRGEGDLALSSGNKTIYECGYGDENETNGFNGSCRFTQTKDEYLNYYEELINKYKNQALTYKHTFEKTSDGNYYWRSSEIVD